MSANDNSSDDVSPQASSQESPLLKRNFVITISLHLLQNSNDIVIEGMDQANDFFVNDADTPNNIETTAAQMLSKTKVDDKVSQIPLFTLA